MPLTTTTTLDTFIPEVWSKITNDFREAKLSLANMFDRRREAEFSGQPYDIIHIQGRNSFQDEASAHANTLGVGGTLTYDAARVITQVNLTIDTHVYQAFDLEMEAEMLNNVEQLERYASIAAYAVAHRIDDDAAAFVDDFDNAVGALGAGLDDVDVRRAKQYLDDAFAPQSPRYFAFSHAEHNSLMGIERYVNNLYKDAIGKITTDKYEGFVGSLYGMDWYAMDNMEGSNTAGHDNGMWHPEAVSVVILDNMRTASQYAIDTDSTKYAVHALYGMIEIRGNHGVFCRGL